MGALRWSSCYAECMVFFGYLRWFCRWTASPPRTPVDRLIGSLNSWRLLWHGRRWLNDESNEKGICFVLGGKASSSTESGKKWPHRRADSQHLAVSGLCHRWLTHFTGANWRGVDCVEWMVPSWNANIAGRADLWIPWIEDSEILIFVADWELTLSEVHLTSSIQTPRWATSLQQLPTGTDDLRTFGSCRGDHFWRGFLRGILLSNHEAWFWMSWKGLRKLLWLITPPLGRHGMRITKVLKQI